MEKPVAVIEITDSCVRLLIGNVVDGKPVIIHTSERPLRAAVSRGEINDYASITALLASFTDFKYEETRLHVTISEATVIFPPIGFQVYQTEKTTNVVSPTSIIEQIDIQNAISLVQKEAVPGGSEIIDIIPDAFILEQGRAFAKPPLGEKSNSITIRAKVHTMPGRIISSYREVVEKAKIRAKRCLVAPYATCEYIRTLADMPHNYLLMDVNDGYTALTLVNMHSPIVSGHFLAGRNDLILRVAQSFNIDEAEAERVVELYGVDDRELGFKPVIAQSQDEFGRKINYYPEDLNKVIREFFADYLKQFDVSYGELLTGFSEELRKLPIIISGSIHRIKGVEKILKDKFTEPSDVKFLQSSVVGAYGPKWATSVGAVLVSANYKGSLADQRAKVSQVGRIDQSKK